MKAKGNSVRPYCWDPDELAVLEIRVTRTGPKRYRPGSTWGISAEGLTDIMAMCGHKTIPQNAQQFGCVIVPLEANAAGKLRGDFEAMVRRRFQNPKPFKKGRFWWLRIWDMNPTGSRKPQRIKLARADMPAQEVKKIAEDKLRPMNQGLELTGSAMSLSNFVTGTYEPTYLPLLSSSTQDCYKGVISKYLKPRFGNVCLRDLTRQTLQQYFSGMAGRVSYPTISKIRDGLSSILRSAVEVGYLNKSGMDGVRLPLDKRPRRPKPTITRQQFNKLVQLVSEPYATMIYVAVWTGLRVSELIGLKWRCIQDDSITIEERYCRGDWSVPKTDASAATIGVIARLLRLKDLTVEVRARRAVRKYKAVKSAGPDDLVFQSVKDAHPMNDQNILKRHLQPAAEKLGLPFVNWRCLGTSHATWLVQAGADPKSVQGQMRHSCISTTMDLYAQNRARSATPCTEATFPVCFTVHFAPITGVL